MKRILLLGCGGAAGLNFTKSLRMVAEHEKFCIVGTDLNIYQLRASGVDKEIHLPHTKDFTEELQQIIKVHDIGFVHAQPDVMVKRLAERRKFCKARFFLPDDHTLAICQNKWDTYNILKDNHVPVPYSVRPTVLEDIADLYTHVADYTGQKRVWVRAIEGAGSHAALPVESGEQAANWVKYWHEMKSMWPRDFMLCEWLPGREFAFQSIWKDGEIITSAARERREYLFGHLRPSGQSSTPSVAVSVHNERVNEVAFNAIKAVSNDQAHGIFCVDMKEDQEGQPKITEINAGRFFTTSDFFSALGCNMPYHYVRLGYGETIKGLEKFNAAKADIYWIRSVDREPYLL